MKAYITVFPPASTYKFSKEKWESIGKENVGYGFVRNNGYRKGMEMYPYYKF